MNSLITRKDKSIIVITTLAEYQTRFWSLVGLELNNRGIQVVFISFDDRSTEMLEKMGFKTYFLESIDLPKDVSNTSLTKEMNRFGITDFPYWSSHERLTFGLRESELRVRFLEYLSLADRVFNIIKEGGNNAVLVQELGGFLSVIASYYAAIYSGIDNWFVEPAFFRGRLFFLKNSFSALKISNPVVDDVSTEVSKYLSDTMTSGQIVVPKKDRHQYTTAFSKVLNIRNVIRLFEKLYDKYILRKRQEFGYIGRYVSIHAQMIWNSINLRNHYTSLDKVSSIIYYPLHVPGDMALTLRSPQYLDQLALIELILRSIPHSHQLAIKEHPAMMGAVNYSRLIELKKRYENFIVLPPSTNNFQVIRAADLVISVNSKSGAEAILLGKPVIVLGDAFYRHSPMAQPLDDLGRLKATINGALQKSDSNVNQDLIEHYFEAVWRDSHPGELYVCEKNNISVFVDSIIQNIK